MDIKTFIPYTESLPAPAEILILLEQLFFLIHIVLINSILGLSFIMIYKRIFLAQSERTEKEFPMIEDKLLAKKIPILFALAINMAIPALLFIQVVFGHLFYTSSVLVGTFWILIIPLLIIAYYASYFHYKKFDTSKLARFSLFVVALVMLYIAFILVNNLSLMEDPGKWSRYFQNRSGTVLLWDELSIYPRYLHFIAGSIAVAGAFYCLYYRFRKNIDKNRQKQKIKEGLKIFSYATMVQIVVGILFLLSLPEKIMLNFIGGDSLATLVFLSGVIFAIIALLSGIKGKVHNTTVFLLLTLFAMVINRYHLRIFHLGDNFSISELRLIPQWDVFIIFLLILFAGTAVIVYMLKLVFFRGVKR